MEGLRLPLSGDISELLGEFGLTQYEAKLYLSASKLGSATASQIGKASGVRREEVYRTLPKLEKAGLVERVLGRPVKFKALPIDDGVSMLIKRKEDVAQRELAALSRKREMLLRMLSEERSVVGGEDNDGQFILISDRDLVAKRMDTLINGARNSIEIADSIVNIIRFLLNYEDPLKEAIKRNVDIRILTDFPDDDEALQSMLVNRLPKYGIYLKYVDDIPSQYVLFDRNEVMLATAVNGSISDSKSLWTQDSNLVSLIRRDFQDMFENSVDWFTYVSDLTSNIVRSLKRLRPRDHVVLFYDSSEVKHEVLFSYIKQGLLNGEAATYVCSEETPEEIAAAMEQYGIDVNERSKKGALTILEYTELYIKNNEFSIEDVIADWKQKYDRAISAGFSGFRVTGEMSCFIKHDLTEELLEYERALHSVLDIPMTAICAYNSKALDNVKKPINVYSELVKAHGRVIYAGEGMLADRLQIRQ